MSDATYLDWPFFDDAHRAFARELDAFARAQESEWRSLVARADDDAISSKALVRRFGDAGWLRQVVPSKHGGVRERLDVRTLCLARDVLGRRLGLADFAFAMQGLGSGPISLYASDALAARWLPGVARGETVAAFALSESDAGSDVLSMTTTATRDGRDIVVEGEKTWISNAGIADFYVVFARWPEGGARSFIALVVEGDNAGLEVTDVISTMAPHPLGRIVLRKCRVSVDAVVGEPGRGLRVALGTLDVFRSTVGAAALGFARRALDEAVAHVTSRRAFGRPLAEFQLTQARLAAMATEIDAAALLVYRAAWTRDCRAERVTREAAMAKWYATEAAQRVIDSAVQLLGARGVVTHHPVEELYREIRALRIYEGTSEIQQLVIAGQLLSAADQSEVSS
jgi:acyl-CoA dehydrogenase